MKFNIELTWSKIMSLLILISGTVYSILNEEATVITLAILTSAGLLGWKQQKDKEKLNLNEKSVK